MKKLFMIFAISFVSIGSFSNKLIRLEFDPLSLKYGLTVFQKVGLSITFLNFHNVVFSFFCFLF